MSTANTQGKKKSVARLGTTKIFIGNIRDGTTSESLRELFECYGRVTEADVLSGFGFVHMENEQDAQTAIRSLNGHILNGNRINVEMSTSSTQGKMRDRDNRANRPAVGVRYDPYPVTVATVTVPRRTEPVTYDTYAGAVAAGTSHASVTSYAAAAPPAAVAATADPYQLQPIAAAFPRVQPAANSTDSFARELLELYSANPTAFATFPARSPLMRQSAAGLGSGAVPMLGVTELTNSYAIAPARTDYFEKRLGPGFGDINLTNLAPASSLDPFASMMAPLHDPSSASRGFSAVRVAPAGPPGVAFGAATAQPTVMRAARVPMAGTLQHLYAPFE